MKKKTYKIFGVALVVMLVASLLAFAAPVSAAPAFPATANKWTSAVKPVEGAQGGWFSDPNITRVGPIAKAIDGTLFAYVENASAPASPNDIFISKDGGRSWTTSPTPGKYAGGRVVDMVCDPQNAEILYVTDGNYVYKSVDGGMNYSIVAKENLEYNLEGDCGITITDEPITCIDVGYNAGDQAIVFIGTRGVGHIYDAAHPSAGDYIVGSVYWINQSTYPAEWDDLQLFCYGCCDSPTETWGCFDVYAVGADPGFADTNKVYALITTDDLSCGSVTDDPSTQVVYSLGTTCAWTFVSELFWNCDTDNPLYIVHASRFAFPDDFTQTHTMFIGVSTSPHADDDRIPDDLVEEGGDVYRVVDDGAPANDVAIDLNVAGYTTGCLGIRHANICSLDMVGGTDDGSLIAGSYDGWEHQEYTNVYYSNDGGWTWASSKKDPLGRGLTYVLYYEDSAVAGTWACECGFFMSCGDEVGEYWNGISLQNMDIDIVLDLSHAPGYIDGASTMYMLTFDGNCCQYTSPDESTSLLRWDGTYWERVWNSRFLIWGPHWSWGNMMMDWVEVSPDFNTTGCVYMASTDFQMLRSIDTGCSWSPLTYPCEPRPYISAWIVVDEETVLAAGCSGGDWDATGHVFKTDRHGTRPWDDFPIMGACCGVDFDLSPNIGSDGQVLLGDGCGQVFISEDVGSSWSKVHNPAVPPCSVLDDDDTYVQFDPGYGTSGDPGENMIYAAAGTVIGRCNINPDAMWDAQCWEAIKTDMCHASGIDAAGDTALYVSDAGIIGDPTPRVVTIDGSIEMDCLGCPGCGPGDLGGYYSPWGGATVTELSGAFEDGEIVEIISYNLECECYDGYWDSYFGYMCFCYVWGELGLRGVESGAIGTAYIDAWYWADDTEEVYDYYYCFGATGIISSHLIATVVGAADTSCPAGVWRTLNPMAPIPPVAPVNLVEFEFLNTGLNANSVLQHDTFTYWTDDLWLTTSGASNILWCLDYMFPTYVWVWDDPLANPVILASPACGTQLPSTSGVTLEWEALDGATEYEIELYQYCPQCPDEKTQIDVPNSMDTCAIVDGLAPGTEHFWRVRVAAGSPFLSKWSQECSFTTALAQVAALCSPVCGAKDIILTTNFSWEEVPGAASYELQIVAAGADGTADFTGAATFTTDVNALASIPGLEYSTVYYWRVRAVTGSIPGAWAVCIFTTMDEPAEPIPPADLIVELPDEEVITPMWIWVLIGIGAALTIAVVILIVTTRRVP